MNILMYMIKVKYHTQDLTSILESVITVLNTQAIMSNTHIRLEQQ